MFCLNYNLFTKIPQGAVWRIGQWVRVEVGRLVRRLMPQAR